MIPTLSNTERQSPATASTPRPRRRVRWLVLLIALIAVAAALLCVRTYRTATMLASAYEAGVPHASTVRPWMTLDYVASTYRVPEAALRSHLDLAPDVASRTTLKALARSAGVSLPDYVGEVQRAIAAAAPESDPVPGSAGLRWIEPEGDDFIAAVLVYGYPAIALTLMVGALGVPLPSALSMLVAGSLAAQGRMSWPLVAAVATASSVAGDVAGYGLGRLLGGRFLDRHGRWLGVTRARRMRVERLLERWGALGVLLSRSLVSVLSSAVNLVAGIGRYRLRVFILLALVGRALWTSAYLGLGYVASGGVEPAADFLASLTGLLASLALLAGLVVLLRRWQRPSGIARGA